MATSVQRIIIIVLLLNFMVPTMYTVYTFSSANDLSDYYELTLNQNRNFTSTVETGIDSMNPDTQLYLDKTYGDVALGQKSIFGIFKDGVLKSYAYCFGTDCGDLIERWAHYTFSTILWLINIILILEGIYFLYSKKYS